MKVVVLGPIYTSRYFGGVAVFDENIALAFAKSGNSVYLCTRQQDEGTSDLKNVNVIHYKYKVPMNIRDADLVIASLDYLFQLRYFKNSVKIYYIHGFFNMSYYGQFGSFIRVSYQKLFLKYADYVVCNSNFTQIINQDIFNLKIDKVVPLSVSYDYYKFLNKNKEHIKKRKKSILYVGRLASAKNVDSIIKAMKKVSNEYNLSIVGDGPEKRRLENLTKELKLTNVNFLGKLSQEEIVKQYLRSETFISLNPSEPYGIVFFEAMLAGCNIVCPVTGGQIDILENFSSNYLSVNISSEIDIANAIVKSSNVHQKKYNFDDSYNYEDVVKEIMKLINCQK